MINKKDGTFRSSFKHIPDMPIYFNNLNKSLMNYINSESPAKAIGKIKEGICPLFCFIMTLLHF
jgi:hypothetical protein